MRCLESNDSALRSHAALALGAIGCDDPTVLLSLERLLDDSSLVVRAAAASATLELADSARAIDVLSCILERDNEVVASFWAINGLAEVAQYNSDVLPVLVASLSHWNDEFREIAAEALSACDPIVVIPLLLETLDQGDRKQRFGVLFALREFGQLAGGYEESITTAVLAIGAIEFQDTDVRRMFAHVAGSVPLRDERIQAELLKLAEDADE